MLDHIHPGTNLIVPTANGEPVTVLDAIEAGAGRLERVRVHQLYPLRDRPHHAGAFGSATSPTSSRRRSASTSSAVPWSSCPTT